jgi:hypothetical protein
VYGARLYQGEARAGHERVLASPPVGQAPGVELDPEPQHLEMGRDSEPALMASHRAPEVLPLALATLN